MVFIALVLLNHVPESVSVVRIELAIASFVSLVLMLLDCHLEQVFVVSGATCTVSVI